MGVVRSHSHGSEMGTMAPLDEAFLTLLWLWSAARSLKIPILFQRLPLISLDESGRPLGQGRDLTVLTERRQIIASPVPL